MIFKPHSRITSGLTMAAILMVSIATVSFGQENPPVPRITDSSTATLAHSFIKKHYSISGTAKVVETEAGTEIVFSEDFETRSGPDLKVYLSKLPIETLDDSTVKENSLKIGVLKSKAGAQSYILPDGITLSEYESVIIHCEVFSRLWGGFDL